MVNTQQQREQQRQAEETIRAARQRSIEEHDPEEGISAIPPSGRARLPEPDYGETGESAIPPSAKKYPPGTIIKPPQPKVKVPEVSPPPEAKLVEKTAQGEAAVYQKDKTRYYAPGSTMYKMGFRTNKEYLKAQRVGAPYGIHEGKLIPENTIVMFTKGKPDFRLTPEELTKPGFRFAMAKRFQRGQYRYAVKDFKGNELLLTQRQVDKIYNATDKEQFNYLVSADILPKGTEYVKPEFKGQPWGYILPQRERLKADLPEVKIPAPQEVRLIPRTKAEAKKYSFKPHLEKIAVNLGISPKLAPIVPAAAAGAAVEPTPAGEILLYGGIAALVLIGGSKVNWPELKKNVQAALADYRAKYRQEATADDVLIVDGTAKKVATLAEVVEMAKPRASIEELTRTRPDIKPVEVKKWEPHAVKPIDIKSGEQLIPPEVEANTMMVTKGVGPREIADVLEQPIPGTNVKWQEPVIVLPGSGQAYPKRLIHDTTKLTERAGMMVAASQRLVKVLPYSRQEWDDIQQVFKQRELDETIKAIEAHLAKARQQGRITPEIARHYRAAYEEYLRRKAAYEEAKRAYIKSLNPQPVKGKLSDAAIKAYATYLISQAVKGETAKPGTSIDKYVVQLVIADVQTVIDTATKAATEAYTKALAQGATETEAKAAAQAAAETATQSATKVIPNTAVRQAVRTATSTLANTATMTATTAATATLTARPATIRTPKIPKLPLPSEETEEEKRKLVKRTRGTVAWNMGKLGKPPKDVWHVRFPDGRHLVLVGKKPEGARIMAEGPGSAYKTTQVIKGNFQRVIQQQHGAVTATIRPARIPKGAKISFTPRTTTRRPKLPKSPSVKVGKIYYTPAGNATLMSRRPLGRRRGRR